MTTLRFPAGAVQQAAKVRITRLAELPAPLPRGVRCGGYGLDVQVREQGGGEIDRLEQPVTVVQRYTGTLLHDVDDRPRHRCSQLTASIGGRSFPGSRVPPSAPATRASASSPLPGDR